ncbi:MAG: GTPase Era [Candidatus Lambdaproteobacteria bacterium]|nr:GTPase Era [Candidatus Lambdaproteobacteria bacterium]
MAEPLRSGFVSLVGRPNVGKSTLVNRLVGRAISITDRKPQTTRNRILGVRHGPGYQLVLVDTPGIHAPTKPLNRRMVAYALAALQDAEVVLMVIEPVARAPFEPHPEDARVLEVVRKAGRPAFLVINKIDRAGAAEVLATIRGYAEERAFAEIVPVSALTGQGVERLAELVIARLPEGPPYFEPDQVTDQSEPMVIAELIRQEVFRRTEQELPYATAVRIEAIRERPQLLMIEARILCERESQKGILIGRGGRMLKAIGQHARRRIEALLGTSVYLELRVAVLKDWSSDPRRLTELGYPEEG